MKIPVILKSYKETPNKGYWDYAMMNAVFTNELWRPVNGYEFEFHDDFSEVIKYGIVVIPARYHVDKYNEINADIGRMDWVILILIGDEDGAFPAEKIQHPHKKVWLMLPHRGNQRGVDRFLMNGWPTGTRERLRRYKEQADTRPLDYFFSGQITHSRRRELVEALSLIDSSRITGRLITTDGFTKGVPQDEFCELMVSSKVAPCPSGAVVPDSFRFYEALEAGCVPLADGKAPNRKIKNFWQILFGTDDPPFPILSDWSDVAGHIEYYRDVFPSVNNKIFSWWQAQKRQLVYNLRDDIANLFLEPQGDTLRDKITVLVPTSPIRSHPSTEIIEQTIATIRERLVNAEIIIMIDGIRPEEIERTTIYQEYIRSLLWKCNFEYSNVLPLVFPEHSHQIKMTREALKLVRTPCVLFVEHDTPLCEPIPFSSLADIVASGDANMIRLHHEALILKTHQYLMLDRQPQEIQGIPLLRTAQWSQRPHLASTTFYRHLMNDYFKADTVGMIEDGLWGTIARDFQLRGQVGWNEWKLWIYAPEGDMKRSYHIDGRGSDPKFENTFNY